MRIGELELDLSNPCSSKTFETYIGAPRAAVLFRESVIGQMDLRVYFKPPEILKTLPVEMTIDELWRLLILEVLFLIHTFNYTGRSCAELGFETIVNDWLERNGTNFLNTFGQLIHNGQAQPSIQDIGTKAINFHREQKALHVDA